MKKIKSIVLVALLACGLSASAQRGTEASKTVSVAPSPEVSTVVASKGTFLKSGIKSLGTVGDYEIVQVKLRGLDTPNLATVLVYDTRTREIVGQQSAAGPGLGAAIVNGGASVGASYLFGGKIRPDTTSVSGGGAATSINTSATANGGAGGNGTGGNSNANGNGGNATGGAGGAGGNGGSGGTSGPRTPPGLVNNPGHQP